MTQGSLLEPLGSRLLEADREPGEIFWCLSILFVEGMVRGTDGQGDLFADLVGAMSFYDHCYRVYCDALWEIDRIDRILDRIETDGIDKGGFLRTNLWSRGTEKQMRLSDTLLGSGTHARAIAEKIRETAWPDSYREAMLGFADIVVRSDDIFRQKAERLTERVDKIRDRVRVLRGQTC